MASNDPAFVPPATEDMKKGSIEDHSSYEEDRPVAPDQFDPRYETSRREIWAYYLYYVGNNGLTLFNFAPTAFQNLLYQAAGDSEVLHFVGSDRTINSIVLLANGISFAIQVVLFLIIGSYAGDQVDFLTIERSWQLQILGALVRTSSSSCLWLPLQSASDGWVCTKLRNGRSPWECISWGVCRTIDIYADYIANLSVVIAYQTTLTFWTAAFPGLARNTSQLRAKAEELNAGIITRDEYDYEDTMQRSRLSNIAFYVQSCGEIIILAVIVGVLYGVDVRASEANNNWGLSVLIAFATGVWLVLAIPWFVVEKRRPGQPVPPNMNMYDALKSTKITRILLTLLSFMVGIWQLYRAITQIWRLKQSVIYLIGKTFTKIDLNFISALYTNECWGRHWLPIIGL